MFNLGDIVKIFAPQAGHIKYHVCIFVGGPDAAHRFLYMNSDPTFDETYEVNCDRVPCLPKSDTGKTVFTFAVIPRYTDRQLVLYKAEKLGELDKALAEELWEFASTVRTLNNSERVFVRAALAAIRDQV